MGQGKRMDEDGTCESKFNSDDQLFKFQKKGHNHYKIISKSGKALGSDENLSFEIQNLGNHKIREAFK